MIGNLALNLLSRILLARKMYAFQIHVDGKRWKGLQKDYAEFKQTIEDGVADGEIPPAAKIHVKKVWGTYYPTVKADNSPTTRKPTKVVRRKKRRHRKGRILG